MTCPVCGQSNVAGAQFCAQCRNVLPATQGHHAATLAGVVVPIAGGAAQLGAGAGSGGAVQESRAPAPEAILRTIGDRYDLLEVVGRGGMGVVHRAYDRELGEEIAVKLLLPSIMDDLAELERFKREIKTARRITHPNAVRIYDFGVVGNEPFISMELLTGGTLADLLARGPMSVDDALKIAVAICDGLAEAHRKGIIHRDLKPQNVLFDEEGHAKVADFGMARAVDSASMTQGFSGTPHYMSPEQGEGKAITRLSDVYSLGVVLFELFTGRKPFEADNLVRLAVLHAQHAPPNPREYRPELPPDVEGVILRCLRKAPEARYPEVDALASDLRSILLGHPVSVELTPARGFPAPVRAVTPVRDPVPVRGASHPRAAAPRWGLAAVAFGGGFIAMAGAAYWWSDLRPVSPAVVKPARVAAVVAPSAVPAHPATQPTRPRVAERPMRQVPSGAPAAKAVPVTAETAVELSPPVPAPRPAGAGFLTVKVAGGWAMVQIDAGEPHENLDVDRSKLSEGKHTLKIVNEDAGIDARLTIDIRPDQLLTLRVDPRQRAVLDDETNRVLATY